MQKKNNAANYNGNHIRQKGNASSPSQNTKELPVQNHQLNLSDFALFLSVMKVKEAYEDVLSIILDEPNLTLKEVRVEQVVLNKSGRRAIRLDAWAQDTLSRQFDMEMQNNSSADNLRKRSRFYQSLIDTPILKSGKKTRYRHLPSTAIIFITQDDIFERDLAMYTFREWCCELPDLPLDDGTTKIFLNMTSKKGRRELVSLLQYMKNTTINNPEILVKDKRLLNLDRIVQEVMESEEWEDAKMDILEIGIEQGRLQNLVRNVDSVMKNFGIDLPRACEGLEISVKEYEQAKEQIAIWAQNTAPKKKQKRNR